MTDKKQVKFDPSGPYPSIEKDGAGNYEIKQGDRVYGSGRTEAEANEKARKYF